MTEKEAIEILKRCRPPINPNNSNDERSDIVNNG